MSIDTDRGYAIEPGGIGEQQRGAEVEDSRAHGVPRGCEVLRDDVDTHFVDDNGLQRPQASGAGELRPADACLRWRLRPALAAVRTYKRADADGQGHCSQPDRRMDEPADPRRSDSTPLLGAVAAFGVVVGDQAQHGQMPAGVVLADGGESEFVQTECGVKAWRGKVVHQGPWVVMES